MQASMRIMEQVKVANHREEKRLRRQLLELKQNEKTRRYEIRGEQLNLRREVSINMLSNMRKSLSTSDDTQARGVSQIELMGDNEVFYDDDGENTRDKPSKLKLYVAEGNTTKHYGLSMTATYSNAKRAEVSKANNKMAVPSSSINKLMSTSNKISKASSGNIAEMLNEDYPKEVFVYYPRLTSAQRSIEASVKTLLPSGVLKLPDLMPTAEKVKEHLVKQEARKSGRKSRLGHNRSNAKRLQNCDACKEANKIFIYPPKSNKRTVYSERNCNMLNEQEQRQELVGKANDNSLRVPQDIVSSAGKQHSTTSSNRQSGKLPAYVQLLGRMKADNFDQFTDGSMHLEVRRQEQIQRERMGVPAGHLPVRRRHTVAEKSSSSKQESGGEQKITRPAPPPPNSAPVRIFISKEMRADKKHEDSKQQAENIIRVKKAIEMEAVRQAISKTTQFLGRQPISLKLIHDERLTNEESKMLNRMKLGMSMPNTRKDRRRQVRFRHSAPSGKRIHDYSDDDDENDDDDAVNEELLGEEIK